MEKYELQLMHTLDSESHDGGLVLLTHIGAIGSNKYHFQSILYINPGAILTVDN